MMEEIETVTARAVRLAGGPKKIAKKLKIKSLWSIYKWVDRNEVPPKRVLDMEKLSGISRHELRPDIHGPAP